MQGWDTIYEGVISYHAEADLSPLKRVVDLFEEIQWPAETIDRDSPIHPLVIAKTLLKMRMDVASLACALLVHPYSQRRFELDTVKQRFGDDIAFLLEGISRISLLSLRTPEKKQKETTIEEPEEGASLEDGPPTPRSVGEMIGEIHHGTILVRDENQAEGFRKLVLAMAKDIRVILIRLVLCLHQLRLAMRMGPVASVANLSHEVMEIYAPIAHRLGVYWLKNELEDLAFRMQWPGQYDAIRAKVLERRKGGEDVVQKVIAILGDKLVSHHIQGQVFGREKHLYSVWSKINRKQITLDDMFDLIAYRIIVPNKEDCYRTLGMIHSEFKPIPGRFKDYVAIPKRNGYQSLHTVVFGPFGNRIEIQIRTEKMHQIAESGVAAHWSYKGKGGGGNSTTGYAWLKDLLALQESVDDPGQFVENVRFDLFPEEIYVFTPNGEIITLPSKATPVDFAYAVHSQVGNSCQGAKINGRIVPLKTPLVTGDTISIITGKNREPNPNWLQFVVTSKAKYWIGRFVKEKQRQQSIGLGREILEREGRKVGSSITEKQLRVVLETFRCENIDDLYYNIGISRVSALQVVHKLFPGSAPAFTERKNQVARAGVERRGDKLALTGALEGIAVQAARCCSPLPGDVVVGIINTGRGITLHRISCNNLKSMEDQPERWVEDINWGGDKLLAHTARIRAMVSNRRGLLTPISQVITEAKANLLDVHVQDRDRDPCMVVLEVEVINHDHLERVLANLRSVPEVRSVDRMNA
ncbi:(p)ppGpp synthetase I, SpoT/RelA [Magnetococcus marinus MC-1]|uniref:GTP pyrophosphokinase n=1 Tax=Magnetococcus marinus (strain ATCC BAA-1437 / JCM 17883 / MC-1) TaxID=156889 RepID=A0L487_MAGMM|nr:RelA/SpoT family protein [Magnetococcus marinus]ABK42780.1 (p)ppGpp synthetase I, SpoT/RelA [Magnetococcus marinus MC-1]